MHFDSSTLFSACNHQTNSVPFVANACVTKEIEFFWLHTDKGEMTQNKLFTNETKMCKITQCGMSMGLSWQMIINMEMWVGRGKSWLCHR